MKWLLYLVIFLALVVGVVFGVGYILPMKTTLSRSITLKEKPAEVFAVLADVRRMAEWNRNTKTVEMVEPTNGKETTRQTFKDGMVMNIITTESNPPRHLVRELGDKSGPFAGSWTYDLTPTDDGGTHVVLTEVSELRSPLFRVMSRVFGQTKYIDEHLEDLGKKFGETVTVQ